MNEILHWIDIARDISDMAEAEKSHLPYNFNIVDELHANENAHTRILLKLLSYRRSGNCVYLQSFLNMMNRNNQGVDFPVLEIGIPEITFNSEYIDGLIEEPSGKYALIIENKINWAADQNRQIERYLNTVRTHGVAVENIYVVYLTLDGRKKVSQVSLSEQTNDLLGRRFVEMNYRDDILPWLKNDVLSDAIEKEPMVDSGVRQYIDHLEGRMNARKSEKAVMEKLIVSVREKFKFDSMMPEEQWNMLLRGTEDVQQLLNVLYNLKNEIMQTVLCSWNAVSRSHFGDGINDAVSQGGYYQIFCNGIDRSVHFEWCPLNDDMFFCKSSFPMELHVENDRDGIKMDKMIRNRALIAEARKMGYKVVEKNRTVLNKEYLIPSEKSYSKMSDKDRKDFLDSAYREVKTLSRILEDTWSLLYMENYHINDLIVKMNAGKNDPWHDWHGYLIVTSFNDLSHKIGIEGKFVMREDRKLVFRSCITVWDIYDWSVYEQELYNHYPGCMVEKCDWSSRMYMHFPDVEIGCGCNAWDGWHTGGMDKVSDLLHGIYRYMSELTERVGK